MDAYKVVLDTNVLLSLYVFENSRFAPFLGKIETGDWQVFTRSACLEEFRRVLAYPLFALTAERQEQAFLSYCHHACLADDTPARVHNLPRCSDRDDQKYLELARDVAAECLITSDKALLKIGKRDRLKGLFQVITPEVALARLQELALVIR